MNTKEHLLACLAEACAEVAQAVGKALRFGLDDKGPDSQLTNAELIAKDIIYVIAVVEMLEEAGFLPTNHPIRAIEEKKNRVDFYMDYAARRGTLIG